MKLWKSIQTFLSSTAEQWESEKKLIVYYLG